MSVFIRNPIIVNTKDEQFFKELGARIAEARRSHGITQQALAEHLGIAQQTLAHYEVGRIRLPASMLPTLAQLLTLSLDELMGTALPKQRGKRGPTSRLQQQIEAVEQLPKAKQRNRPANPSLSTCGILATIVSPADLKDTTNGHPTPPPSPAVFFRLQGPNTRSLLAC